MSLDGVNSSKDNTALYAAGAAAGAGAIAGGATGYYTKSFLKDDAPTDEFVTKASKNMQNAMPKETVDALKQLAEEGKKCKNAAEYKDLLSQIYKTGYSIIPLEDAKNAMAQNSQMFELMGLKGMDEAKIASATSVDELVEQFGKHFDDVFAGKSVKEIQAAYDKAGLKVAKANVINILSQIYDFDKKKFLNFDELFDDTPVDKAARKVAQAVKDAASSIKWKAAGIYGGIAASVLGLGTLIGVNMTKQNKEQVAEEEENANVQDAKAEDVKPEEAQA